MTIKLTPRYYHDYLHLNMRQMMLFNRQLNKPAQDKRIHTVANRIATIAPTYSLALTKRRQPV